MALATSAEIHRAAQALRRGELVVFPTETVYGVGAHALDPVAVARIFAAKGRPSDNPLIVHAADRTKARSLVSSWPAMAERLAGHFWPGPLTLVLPRAPNVPNVVTAGLDTVAVRVPSHPIARKLLEDAGVPVAAPSANRSGAPSPTRVEDARTDLGEAVSVYLDGGAATIGLESTVIDLHENRPALLRPGAITRKALEDVVGPVTMPRKGEPARSPGLLHRHYAPRAKLRLVAPAAVARTAADLRAKGLRVAVVAGREDAPRGADTRVPGSRADAEAWARALYSLLRDLDREGYDAVVVEEIPAEGLGEAVLDRLRRAQEP